MAKISLNSLFAFCLISMRKLSCQIQIEDKFYCRYEWTQHLKSLWNLSKLTDSFISSSWNWLYKLQRMPKTLIVNFLCKILSPINAKDNYDIIGFNFLWRSSCHWHSISRADIFVVWWETEWRILRTSRLYWQPSFRKKQVSGIILSISQGSIRVSAVPVRLSTTDAQSAHLSLWQLLPTDFYWRCVFSSGWIKCTRNWFYTRSLSLSKYHQPSRGRNFLSLWLSHNSAL